LPGSGAVLVEGVERIQGLMVAPGNPRKIRDMRDLPNLTYVNRQKGSGTRILCDFLVKQIGIGHETIRGYEREEYTHTAVAAAIAAGTADAGLGILAAAKLFRLDFIPIASETYDFVLLEGALELEHVQHFLEALASREFAERLGALGGYTIREPGRIKEWSYPT
jgi:putative molybdopterin biosynthesis protein